MEIIANSGDEHKIVEINGKYYIISDFTSAINNGSPYYHAIGVNHYNLSWWQPYSYTEVINGERFYTVERYLISTSNEEIIKLEDSVINEKSYDIHYSADE